MWSTKNVNRILGDPGASGQWSKAWKKYHLVVWTIRFSFWASNFPLLLAQWSRAQANHLPTKSLREQTKTWTGQQNSRASYCTMYSSQEQTGIQFFYPKEERDKLKQWGHTSRRLVLTWLPQLSEDVLTVDKSIFNIL